MADSEPTKTKFMLELLKSDKLNEKQKAKFLELSIQELERMDSGTELAKKAWAEIKKLKEEIKSDAKKGVEKRGSGDIQADNELKPHQPKNTTLFLNKFETDGNGLRELTHTPSDLDAMDINLLKEKAFASLNELKNQNKLIHRWVYTAATKVVIEFFKITRTYAPREKRYPYGEFGGNEAYTKQANDFKSNYRYSVEGEGYSVLRNSMTIAFNKYINNQNSSCRLEFAQEQVLFDDICNLLTWIPAFVSGINTIFSQINERLDDGKGAIVKVSAKKKKKDGANNYVQLLIIHKGSTANKPADKIFKKYAQSSIYSEYFRSLCDWSIEFNKKDTLENYRLNLLNNFEIFGSEEIQQINEMPEGFTHILTFYDV